MHPNIDQHRRRRAPGAARLARGLVLLLLAAGPAALRGADQLVEIEDMLRAGRFTQAIAVLEPMVDAMPDDPEPRFLLGNAYTGAQRYDAAIGVYRALTRAFPERPEPYNNLAVIFVEQGRLEEARTALLAAARLRPGYARAQENLGDLYVLMAEDAFARAAAIREATANGQTVAPREIAAAPDPATTVGTTASRPETVDRRQPSPLDGLSRQRAILEAIDRWRVAWSGQDVDAYLASYVPDYRPNGQTSHEAWRDLRSRRLRGPAWIEVELTELELVEADAERAVVTFVQGYRASNYSDETGKELVLVRMDGRWLIRRERST